MDKLYRSAHQLRVMDRTGTFPARRMVTGQRYCTEGDEAPAGLTVVHCRVSRRGQRADLARQVAAMEAYCLGTGVAVDE